jgi:two-component system OmpR family response regulator
MRVLIVEDDQRISDSVAVALKLAGFIVDVEGDGEEGWFRGDTEPFDAIILDIGLPTIDGLSILKRWRKAGRITPVMILTARSNWDERVEGIDSGADEYLAKPFRPEELLARLRALIRRAAGHAAPMLEVGNLSLDTRQMRLSLSGQQVGLTPQEYRLISYLMHHNGRVVTQIELTEHIYEQDFDRNSNSVEVLVGRLRKKLGQNIIETRRGFGYVIDKGRQ